MRVECTNESADGRLANGATKSVQEVMLPLVSTSRLSAGLSALSPARRGLARSRHISTSQPTPLHALHRVLPITSATLRQTSLPPRS